jgi:hypothetical protein
VTLAQGTILLAITFSREVFPDPEGPKIAVICPLGQWPVKFVRIFISSILGH